MGVFTQLRQAQRGAGAEGPSVVLSAVLSACMHLLPADFEPLEQPRHQDLVEEDLVLHLIEQRLHQLPQPVLESLRQLRPSRLHRHFKPFDDARPLVGRVHLDPAVDRDVQDRARVLAPLARELDALVQRARFQRVVLRRRWRTAARCRCRHAGTLHLLVVGGGVGRLAHALVFGRWRLRGRRRRLRRSLYATAAAAGLAAARRRGVGRLGRDNLLGTGSGRAARLRLLVLLFLVIVLHSIGIIVLPARAARSGGERSR